MRVPVSAVTLLIATVALLAPTAAVGEIVPEAVAEALEDRAEGSIKNFRLAKVEAGEKLSRVERGEGLAPGQEVTVAFDVERDGFVSIWSLDADRKLSRVLPNQFGTTKANGVPVRAGVRYLVGGGGLFENDEQVAPAGAWTLRITEPYGSAEVYVRWTAQEQRQLAEDAFEDVGAFGKSLERATRDSPPPETLVRRYEVVQAP